MLTFEEVPDPKRLLADCLAAERIRYSVHFNALLAEHGVSRMRVLHRLRRSRREKQYDYVKGKDEIPCFGFVAKKTAEDPALTLFVSFERDSDGDIHVWVQEF